MSAYSLSVLKQTVQMPFFNEPENDSGWLSDIEAVPFPA